MRTDTRSRCRRWPALLLIALLAGCSEEANPVPARYPPEKAAEVAMELYDTNRDGQITGPELDKCLALKYSLERLGNRDKAVTADEIAQRMREYDEQSTHVSNVVQVVSRQGPVSGATITMELEPFMGEELPSYSATTDESGSGVPKPADAGENFLGIPVGFYRVTISAPGQSGDVVRGAEVADDAPTANRLVFSLQDEAPQGGGRFGGR